MHPTKTRRDCSGGAEGWIEAARRGDREAIGQALETCRRYLLLVADRELGPDLRAKEGASDLVQQAFLEAHRDFARFQGRTEGELRAWLRAILRNDLAHAVDRYRRTGKRAVGREVSMDDTAQGGLKETLAEEGDSASERVIVQEQAEALRVAIGRLPEAHRQVLDWRHREGESFEEIGRRLGCSADAARKTWGRIIARLQEELGRGTAR